MASRRAAALLFVAVCAVGVMPQASAADVSGERFRRLAEQATTDPPALAELRTVSSVDGEPVDVELALAGASGEQLTFRLRVLAEAAPAAAVEASTARGDAEEILSQRRFRSASPPQLFRGVLERLGEWLLPVAEAYRRAVAWLLEAVPAWVGIPVVAAAAAWVAAMLIRRRTRVEARAEDLAERALGRDPERLEREAGDAEGRGELEKALRLRFRAGLIRLGRAGVIDYRPSITTGEVDREIRSARFRTASRIFDEVVYGGRAARRDDVEESKAAWWQVLEQAGRR